jgi:hypothetical protein
MCVTSVQVIARTSGTTEHKTQQSSSGQKHAEGSDLASQAARKVRILSLLKPFRLGYEILPWTTGVPRSNLQNERNR